MTTCSQIFLTPCSSLEERYQLSHPYKNIQAYTILYISVFNILDRIWKDNFTHGYVWKRKCVFLFASPLFYKTALC
jgi:hypothetical protein